MYRVLSLTWSVFSEAYLAESVTTTGTLSRRSHIAMEVPGVASVGLSCFPHTLVAQSRKQSSTTLDISSRSPSICLDRTRHAEHVGKRTQATYDIKLTGLSFHSTTCDTCPPVKTTPACARHSTALFNAHVSLAPNSTSGSFVPSICIFQSCSCGASYPALQVCPKPRANPTILSSHFTSGSCVASSCIFKSCTSGASHPAVRV